MAACPSDHVDIPLSCHGCTALLACLRPDRLDLRGQWHLDVLSRLYADWPSVVTSWWLVDALERREWAERGESAALDALRAERSYCRSVVQPDEPGAPARICDDADYVPELDGDPEEGW